jgi:predicted RNA binding protein YcfA (HicA-like mRNA interferase family)
MTAMDWLVVIGGLAAIGWINWYFFLSHRRIVRDDRGERTVLAQPRSHTSSGVGPTS